MKEPVKSKGIGFIHCENCEGEAYTCGNCEEYLYEGQEIICLESEILEEAGEDQHFCNMECYNDWLTAAPLKPKKAKNKTVVTKAVVVDKEFLAKHLTKEEK